MANDSSNIFDYEYSYIVGDKPSKEWLLRSMHRRDAFDRLKDLGKLCLLGQTSILIGMSDTGEIKPLIQSSSSRNVFEASFAYKVHSKAQNRRVKKAPTLVYQGVEDAFRCYMLTVCLAVKETDFLPTVRPFQKLKSWCYTMIQTEATYARVKQYIKWLIKFCQAALLGKKWDEPEDWFPHFTPKYEGNDFPSEAETLPIPFMGELAFIREIYLAGGMTRRPTIREFDTLAQLCMGNRAQPYPSKEESILSIRSVLALLKQPKVISKETILWYRVGLRNVVQRLGSIEHDTHVSLANSGCLEFSREDGGKSAYIVCTIKQLKMPIKLAGRYVNMWDHLRSTLIHKEVYDYAMTVNENLDILQILYLEPENMIRVLQKDFKEDDVPYDLGKCILLACSVSLRNSGSFNEMDEKSTIPYFERGIQPKFKLEGRVKTRASIVEEAGQKTRLITTTLAAKAQMETCLNHVLRTWLKRDPFLRIGLEEPHKLYELLKAYKLREQEALL